MLACSNIITKSSRLTSSRHRRKHLMKLLNPEGARAPFQEIQTRDNLSPNSTATNARLDESRCSRCSELGCHSVSSESSKVFRLSHSWRAIAPSSLGCKSHRPTSAPERHIRQALTPPLRTRHQRNSLIDILHARERQAEALLFERNRLRPR